MKIQQLITCILLVVTTFFTLLSSVSATPLLDEDFESYTLGSWPAPWVKDANAVSDPSNNVIAADPMDSGNKTLKLFGRINSSWGALAYHPVSFPEAFSIQASVYNGSEALGGAHPHRGYIGMRQGTSWTNPSRMFLMFLGDGTIIDTVGQPLGGTYQTEQWYDVRIDYQRSGNDLAVDYWIDGAFVDTTKVTISNLASELSLDHLDLTAQEGSVYFDNVTVEAIPEPSALAMVGLGCMGMVAFGRRKRSYRLA